MVMPRLGRVLLVEHRRVDGAGEGGIGRAQVDGEAAESRLLEVVLRLVGVVRALRYIARVIGIRGANRVIIAHRPVAAKDGLEQRLPVEGVLQGESHVVVVERRDVGAHWNAVVPGARRLGDVDVRVPSQQVHRLEVAPIHGVDLTRLQPVGPCRNVDDRDERDLVEVGAMRSFPVVVVAHESRTNSGIEVGELVPATADPGLPVDTVTARGQDSDVIVADDVGEICVSAFQRDHDGISAVHLDVHHWLQQRLGG